jgi:hypothetical protein
MYRVGERKRVTMLAYRKPDGTVRFCYHQDKPDYMGFEPGVADFDQVTCFYPNESYGYEYHCVEFRPTLSNGCPQCGHRHPPDGMCL